MSSDYKVPAIDNMVKIFHTLSVNASSGLTQNEISRQTGLNRSTVFRLLKGLHQYNLVSYDSSKKTYNLGHLLVYLGGKASEVLSNLDRFQPYLLEIAKRTGQTAILTQLYGHNELIYIAKQESMNDHRINVNIGQIRPLNSTAAGKVFLADRTDEEIDMYLSEDLKAYTNKTLVEKGVFMEEIKKIREKGYAISNEEFKLGLSGIAVPIYDQNQQLLFVMFISCFSAQLTDVKVNEYRDILIETANRINETLLSN
ncbi:IclR family transcriptional regulator [Pseudalkalibacillus sp. A8]|uniref:IclR family transcriptional regulator n=1 Tax=Pseudalkalibacillus sp. A8 TaxID=3382641 RepID=UPI0038B4D7B1